MRALGTEFAARCCRKERLRGNVLRPDIAVTGAVSGSHLQSLQVVVSDEKGRELLRKSLLVPEIAAAYGSRPRSETVTVPFDFKIPGDELPVGAKQYRVTLTAISGSGTVATSSFTERAGLFGALF